MIKRIFHQLLLRRHYWRQASFSEIAELYASRMLRMLALTMASAFLSIYLYQNGYSIQFIALFWAAYYLFASAISIPLAMVTAWIGPKHGILWSNILFIPSMVAFSLLPELGPWVLALVILFQGTSSALYTICFHVDFSKVKSQEHAGKELAYMNIVEKITTGISPLIGGLLAFWLGPQVVLLIAAIIFLLAALPLLRTNEPTQRRQKLQWRGFPWQLIRRTMVSRFAIGFDIFTSGTVWWLFTAISVIGIQANNEVYAANGLLLSAILFSALGASYAYGKLIDRQKGKQLLQLGVLFNSITHFARPFINTPAGVASLNVANEAATTGYVMAYNRGFFDSADVSGHRILFVGLNELIACFGAAIGALTLALILQFVGEVRGMEYLFIITAGVVLLILTARFPLYRK